MYNLKCGIFLFIILFGLWLLLAGTSTDELITGGGVALLLAAFFAPRVQRYGPVNFTPAAFGNAFVYLFVFLAELVKSTLDVARRVLSPTLPINPGIVKVRTSLKSPLGRLVLANSITLTPGTMTVETDGEFYYIHWIDIQADDIDAASAAIVHKFEKYLEVIFD